MQEARYEYCTDFCTILILCWRNASTVGRMASWWQEGEWKSVHSLYNARKVPVRPTPALQCTRIGPEGMRIADAKTGSLD